MGIDPDAVTAPAAKGGATGPTTGKRWGRYEVREPLGSGGMGTVFVAHDPGLDRAVALKVLHDEALGLAGQERLRREARAMAKVAHPNVVPVYEVGEEGGRTYYTMERVRGVSLKEWARAPRPWREVQRVFLDAARGLAAIHAAGLVHRDIKPGNILVGDDGRARVTDLGIAAGEPGAPGSVVDTTTLRGAGTPAYMAPEQLAGEPGDARSDQFAFAMSLFEALHGIAPFPDESLPARIRGIEQGPREGARPVPRWLDAVCRRGLAVRPADRYADLPALIAALEGPRARRWPYLAGGAAVAVGGVALALSLRATAARVEDECARTGVGVRAWSAAARAAATANLGDDAAAVIARLDGVATSWRAVDQVVCRRGRRDAAWTLDLSRRAAECLVERHAELVEAAAGFASPSPDDDAAAAGLIAPATCLDAGFLADRSEPITDLGKLNLSTLATVLIDRGYRQANAGDVPALARTLGGLDPLLDEIDHPPLTEDGVILHTRLATLRGDFAGAAKRLEDAYYAMRARGADLSALVMAARLADLASTDLGDDALAAQWTKIALADAARRPNAPEAAEAFYTAAGYGYRTGALDDAEPAARQAVAIAERLYGPDSWSVGRYYDMLAIVLDAAGRPSEAIGYYRRDLDALRAWWGADALPLAVPLQNLALAEVGVGRLDDAVDHARRALAILDAHAGASQRDRGEAALNLGAILVNADRAEAAIGPLTTAVATLRAALGDAHPDVALAMTDLAQARASVAEAGRDPAALTALLPELEAAVDASRAADGPDHPETLAAEVNLADARVFVADCAAAAPLARHILDAATATGNRALVGRARELRGRCALIAGDPAAAIAELAAAVEARSGDDDPRLRAHSRALLADAQLAAGDRAAAIATERARRDDLASVHDDTAALDAWLAAPVGPPPP